MIAQHESSHQQIEHLKLVIEKYWRMIFGSKSEKLTGQLEQLHNRYLRWLPTAWAWRDWIAITNPQMSTAKPTA